MGGLTVALNTALSGLFAHQQAIAATSENIANVNSADFSRREANFFTDAIPNQFAGVSVEIARAGSNRFLQSAGFAAQADAGALNAIADALANVEASLGAPGDNLDFANALNEAYASFAQLSAAPNSIAARAVAIADLDAAFNAFSRTLDAIDSEVSASDARIETQTARANALLENIFILNQIVSDEGGAGDAIDAAVRELSTLLNISVSRADDGRVTVATADGQVLAGPGGFSALSFAGGVSGQIALANVDPETGVVSSAQTDITAVVTAGEIGGLVQVRNSELPVLRAAVANAAQLTADDINNAYALNASVGATGPATTPLIVVANGGFSVNASIAADPAQLAIARPTAGQPGGANDGSGAGAIAALGDAPSAGTAADAVTQIGAASQIAGERRAAAEVFANDLETRRLSESGVNLDEELSNLILFQRAYNANARVIAAVDELYQTVLNIL
ncbi:MAG: flagellar hook-associated protein FlgK [Pseudomonadota bacterium]